MTIDDSRRAQIAQGWRSATCDQATYAAQFGISERTLRSWVARFGAGDRPEARALAILDDAIDRLIALRAAVVAETEGRSGTEDAAVPEEPERHAEPEPHSPGDRSDRGHRDANAAVARPHAVLKPVPPPGSGFLMY